MSQENDRKITPASGGFVYDLTKRIKLILRLMGDRRVNPFLKVLPVFSLVYLFVFPDLAPGPLDDGLVIWLAAFLFVELCPPEVVQEHMAALDQVVPGEWHDVPVGDDDVIDAEYWEEN
ncbi:MAG: hypothetical protein P8074_01945 [Anaerolineales bacterium]